MLQILGLCNHTKFRSLRKIAIFFPCGTGSNPGQREKGGEEMQIEIVIKTTGAKAKEAMDIVDIVKRRHPNAMIRVEVSVD